MANASALPARAHAHFGMATSASWPSCVARRESGMFLASVVIPSLKGSPCIHTCIQLMFLFHSPPPSLSFSLSIIVVSMAG
jgi:hypothetical protein